MNESIISQNRLALFDFDGTITNTDSFIAFIKYAVGKKKFAYGLFRLGPYILLYSLKIISLDTIKERIIRFFFKGWPEERFNAAARRFMEEKLPGYILQSAFDRLLWHKKMDHHVMIVTGSLDPWLSGWCDFYGFQLIATGLEIKDGFLTGKFRTKNCNHQEKVNRVKQAVDISSYEYIYAYGNSEGDREMLALADEQYYRHFSS
ncbi:MAG: HAD-IB family hydrolase [bacterium]|nr:HAD-IB family hydrolase [bacterium]